MPKAANDQKVRSLAALTDLLAKAAESDVVAMRSARLSELSKSRRAWLSETSEAYELLMEALLARQGAIERGDVQPPPPEPNTQPELPALDDTTEDLQAQPVPTEPETGFFERGEASPEPGSDPSEALTALDLPAINDARIAAVVAAAAADSDVETRVSVDRIEERGVLAAEGATSLEEPGPAAPSEAPTILEMPMLTDEAIAAHLAGQTIAGGGPPDIPVGIPAEMPPVGTAVDDDKPAWVTAVEEHDEAEAAALDSVTPGWTRSAELLFEDTLRLFRLGDSDGALISLERLLASMELNEDLQEFVRVNEERLLQLYHAVLGPWTRIPKRHTPKGFLMPRTFFEVRKIGVVLDQIGDHTTISDIMESGHMSRLESVATLSQLVRARAVVMEEAS